MAAVPSLDPSRCPICGQANQCAMEVEKATGQPQDPCWCMQVDFNAELLAQLPAESRGQACICRSCAEQGK